MNILTIHEIMKTLIEIIMFSKNGKQALQRKFITRKQWILMSSISFILFVCLKFITVHKVLQYSKTHALLCCDWQNNSNVKNPVNTAKWFVENSMSSIKITNDNLKIETHKQRSIQVLIKSNHLKISMYCLHVFGLKL